MVVTRYAGAAEFLSSAEPFLMEDEALNSLLIWTARAQARQASPRRRRTAYYALAGQPGRPEAVALMSNSRKLLLAGKSQRMGDLARDLAAMRPTLFSVMGPADAARNFADAWCSLTGARFGEVLQQRLHAATGIAVAPNLPDGLLTSAAEDDIALLSRWLLAFQREAMPDESGDPQTARIIINRLLSDKDLFVWQLPDGRYVSMAAKARPLRHSVSINLIYTPVEERAQGYATACVAGLTSLLLGSGFSICTILSNRTKASFGRIYAKIGYVPLVDFDEISFTLEPS